MTSLMDINYYIFCVYAKIIHLFVVVYNLYSILGVIFKTLQLYGILSLIHKWRKMDS
jgi:hypothetical protein